MKKRSRAAAAAGVCLAVLCAVGAAAVAADPGSQSDPIVTLSYLTQTVTPQLMAKVDEAVAANEKELVDKLNTAIDSYAKEMNEALENGGSGSTDTYSVVSMTSGQSMKLEIGCEVMLRVGSAVCVSPDNPGLIDTTAGGTLNGGSALTTNHLYMATISGRSIRATAGTKVLVRGEYSLS